MLGLCTFRGDIMRIYFVLILFVLTVFMSCTPLWAADQRVIRVGAFNYYPGIFKDTDGSVKGFYVDALADIAQRENIRFEYVYGSWSEGLERVKAGDVDLLTSVAFTPERAEFLDYVKTPLLTVWGELYVPLASEIDGIRAVQGKKIAVMKGDFNARHFIELVKKFDITCEFVEVAGFDDVFEAVSKKTVDAGVVNSTFGVAKQKEYDLRSTGVVFNPFDIFFAVAKGKNKELLVLLDTYLDNWKHQNDSPFNKARQKWSYAGSGVVFSTPRWLVVSVAVLALFALFAFAFIVVLRRQVHSKTRSVIESAKLYQRVSERQNAILAAVPDIIMEVDRDKVYTWANNAGLAFFGENVLSKEASYYFEGNQRTYETVQPLFDEGSSKALYVESWQRRKDGEVRLLAWWCKTVVDEHGLVTGTLSTARDITEIKRAEDERVAVSERFKTIMDSIDALVYVADMETYELLFINKYGKNLFGDIEGSICWQTLQCGQLAPCTFCTNTRLVLENGQPAGVYVWEFQNTVTGHWYQCRDKAIPWHDNRLVRMEIATDITESKQMELSLRTGKERYKLLTESVSAIPWEFNIQQNRWTYVGPQTEKILGYASDEWSTLEWWQDRIHPDDKSWVPNLCRCLTVKGEDHSLEYRLMAKDGSIVWVNDLVSVEMKDGRPVFLRGIMLDITLQKRSEEEKNRLESQLHQSQKMESVGQLAGGVAHDFNNMLTIILGRTEFALMKMDQSQPLFAHLSEIHTAAERSAALTRQLLTFARKQTIAPKIIDLNETIVGMLKMLQRLIGEAIQLAWLPKSNPGMVKMDPSQIDQILANLCVNARDAIDGIGKITIETGKMIVDEHSTVNSELAPGTYVLLSISDNGCGMSKDTVVHIFEPFFTTKGIGSGTGLGLATVYGIVKQNNGHIRVFSEPGQGTTFTLYLPTYEGAEELILTNDAKDELPRGIETILLVEDEQSILSMATMMLEEQGYTVLPTSSPVDAINTANEYAGDISLLMTDVIMPEMNGLVLANKLRVLYPDIKHLFMSGFTADVIAHHGFLDDGVHFIQKPFTLLEITTIVRDVLDEK